MHSQLPRFLVLSFFLSFFYRTTALSSRSDAGHQMYTRGSVIGRAWFIDRDISLTPPLIFTGGGVKKCDFGLIAQQRLTLSRCGLETTSKMTIGNLIGDFLLVIIELFFIIGAFVWSQFTRLMDRQTDGQTDGFAAASTRLHSCSP